jgi:D-glycero-D-manno-heptose 1,7-bisphosphate phosphatase
VAFLPGALEALAGLARSRPGWRVIIATNQSAVGRGLVAVETVRAINDHVVARVGAAGGRIDGVYVCPHRPDESCPCRKPAPGMLLQAAAEWDLDLAASAMIGDAVTDVQAALAAGVRPILVRTGLGAAQAAAVARLGLEPLVAPDLAAALRQVLDGANAGSLAEQPPPEVQGGGP